MAKICLIEPFRVSISSDVLFHFCFPYWGKGINVKVKQKVFPTCSGVDDGLARFASWQNCKTRTGEDRRWPALPLTPFPCGLGLRGVLWTDWRKQGQGCVCVYESKISSRVFESHGGPFFLFSLSKFTSQRKKGRREGDVADTTLSQTQMCPVWEDRVETPVTIPQI